MSIDVESRTAAALEAWASTVTPTRPSIEELLAQEAAPVGGSPTGQGRRWWVVAAAAVLVVVGAGVAFAATRHRTTEPGKPTTITPATAPLTSTTVAPAASPTGLYAPSVIPDGFEVVGADAWVPSPLETPVSGDLWVRRDESGAVVDQLWVSALPEKPGTPTGPPDSQTVHGLPARAPQDRSSVMWEEAGLSVSVQAPAGVDAFAIAEQTVVTPDGVTLPDDAVPAGFEPVPPNPDAVTPSEVESTVWLQTPDGVDWMSVQATPNRQRRTLEDLVAVDSELRTIGGRQVAYQSSQPPYVNVSWIDGGSILIASASDDALLAPFVASIGPADQDEFDALADQATASATVLPVQDEATFPDGVRLEVRAPTLTGDRDVVYERASLCVAGDRTRCGERTGTWIGTGGETLALDSVRLIADVDGRKEQVAWVKGPASAIGLIVDGATGDPVPYQTIPGDHGVFIRAFVPDGVTTLRVSVWYTDGAGAIRYDDVGRDPVTATVTTDGVAAPAPTGWFLLVDPPAGFQIVDAQAATPDLFEHDPTSQDYWVRRGDDGLVTEWLSLLSASDPDGAVGAEETNLTINNLPAVLTTDTNGVSTLVWNESGQQVTATSTVDPLELASAIEFVSVDSASGVAGLVTPQQYERVDRTAAIVAADSLAVSTTVHVEDANGGVATIATRPNVDGQSFDTLVPRGSDSYVGVGTDIARLTHLDEGRTTLDWFTNGYAIQITATGIDDQALIALAATVQPVDKQRWDSPS